MLHRVLFLLVLTTLPLVTSAQGIFSPVATINDQVVTQFELEQRVRMLELFRTPGDLGQVGLDQLIEDRLKQEELNRAGIRLTDEGLARAMEDFAARANLSTDQFVTLLGQNGVEETTFRDYIRVGVAWRDYIRSRFANRVTVTEADIDRALGQAGGSGTQIEVLLSEIIIPAPPPQAAAATATAERIAQLTSEQAFSAQARRVSALPSRANGGRLDWLPITNYPPALRGLILGLANGQVTPPIQITNGVALFQMRGIREVAGTAPDAAAIDYATFLIPGGRSDSAMQEAARIARDVDTCDDLYGIARGLPADRLQRDALAPADIPQDIAVALATLDPGEVSYGLTDPSGQTLLFLMMCGRTPVLDTEVDRDALRTQLLSQRLSGLADALVADLRAAATITIE